MKQKKIILLALAAVLVLGAVGGVVWYRSSHVFVNGEAYPKDIAEIALPAGAGQAEAETLRAALPNCRVTWQVPLLGDYVPSDTKVLTLETLTQEDVENLAFLTELEQIQGENCLDYGLLAQVQKALPEVDVRYSVPLGTRQIPSDTTELTLEEGDAAQLLEKIPYLPKLESLHIANPTGDPEALRALQEACPQLKLSWEAEVFGTVYSSDVTELDLSALALSDMEAAEEALAWLPNLQLVYFGKVPVDNDTMAAYRQRQADRYKVVWDVQLNYYITIRSDAEYFMPIKFYQTVVNRDLENLKYFNDMITLDVGHMPITHCEWLAYMPKLQYLILADTEIADISPVANLKELIYFEVFDTPVKDYTPLLECPNLKDLNICWTTADPEVIAQLTSLDRLWWWGNLGHDLTEEEMNFVRESLPDTQVVFKTNSSTGSGWRKGILYYKMRNNLGMPYFSQSNPDDPTTLVPGTVEAAIA